MKTISNILKSKAAMAVACLALGTACVTAQTKETVAAFAAIEVSGPIKVIYSTADVNTVEWETAADVKTKLDKGVLTLWANPKNNGMVRVKISGGTLRRITANNGAHVWLTDKVKASEMRIAIENNAVFTGAVETAGLCEISAGADCSMSASIKAKAIAASAKANARLVLSGKADNATLRASGVSQCELRNFDAGKWNVQAAGGSWANMYLGTQNSAYIHVKELARVNYKGLSQRVRINDEAVANEQSNAMMALQN